jgi:hypothetical protein
MSTQSVVQRLRTRFIDHQYGSEERRKQLEREAKDQWLRYHMPHIEEEFREQLQNPKYEWKLDHGAMTTRFPICYRADGCVATHSQAKLWTEQDLDACMKLDDNANSVSISFFGGPSFDWVYSVRLACTPPIKTEPDYLPVKAPSDAGPVVVKDEPTTS